MSVTLISGPMGSGKTLYMTRLLYEHQRRGKRRIYANYGLKFPFTPMTKDTLKSYQDWDYKGISMGIDELHIFMDSKMSMTSQNRFMSNWFLQTRKRGVDFIATTQYPDQIDKRVRRICDVWCECKCVKKGRSVYVIVEKWYTGLKKQKKPVMEVFKANPYFEKYDTNEVIGFE